MKELLKRNLLKGDILDYACGLGLDSEYLWKEYHIQSWRYDKFNTKFKDDFLLDEHYDIITCFYMFNVIDDLKIHREVLEKLKSMTDNLYVAVRSDVKAIRPEWEYDPEGLGYWTPKHTYQRFYTKDNGLVEKLFGKVEYIVNDTSMKLFKLS